MVIMNVPGNQCIARLQKQTNPLVLVWLCYYPFLHILPLLASGSKNWKKKMEYFILKINLQFYLLHQKNYGRFKKLSSTELKSKRLAEVSNEVYKGQCEVNFLLDWVCTQYLRWLENRVFDELNLKWGHLKLLATYQHDTQRTLKCEILPAELIIKLSLTMPSFLFPSVITPSPRRNFRCNGLKTRQD